MITDCSNSQKFFQNTDCACFPCHQGIEEELFNCLFCFCPLYALGKNCGGNFEMTECGIKDCSGCTIPHRADHYDAIIRQSCRLIEKVREEMKENHNPSEKETS